MFLWMKLKGCSWRIPFSTPGPVWNCRKLDRGLPWGSSGTQFCGWALSSPKYRSEGWHGVESGGVTIFLQLLPCNITEIWVYTAALLHPLPCYITAILSFPFNSESFLLLFFKIGNRRGGFAFLKLFLVKHSFAAKRWEFARDKQSNAEK